MILQALVALLMVPVDPPKPKPIDPVVSAAMDPFVSAASAQGFAGEVLVTNDKRVTYSMTVSKPGRPHASGDLWRWASVTKQLTATLVMQAVATGELSLEDTLAQRLPDFHGATADKVTVRMLLQHTSGLANPDDTPAASATDLPDFYRRKTPGAGGVADALGYCAGTPKAAPGAGFAYNNCDYIVLGAVLERVWGKPYAALVQQKLTRPAGLKSLDLAVNAPLPPMTPGFLEKVWGKPYAVLVQEKLAKPVGPTPLDIADHVTPPPRLTPGYTESGGPEPSFVLATFGAAGAAYGTPEDLAAFDRGLMTGLYLDAAATKTAWTGEPKLGYVALGVWSFPAPLKGCDGAVRLVERRGEIGGVEVRNLIAPDKKLALIVFADQAGLDFGEIWQGKGLTYDLASAAFCGDAKAH